MNVPVGEVDRSGDETPSAEPSQPLEIGRPSPDRNVAGTIRVANEVVASIAAQAALEVKGVHALHSSGQQLDRILRRQFAHRGVRVRLLEDDSLLLDLWFAMRADANLAAVGGEVQRRVARALERMLGMRVKEVNVHVSAIVFP